jgi:hypothetical protein
MLLLIPEPIFSIPDPRLTEFRICIKEFQYCFQALGKMVWDPDLDFFPSRIQGSKERRIPDPQHRLVATTFKTELLQDISTKKRQ